MFSTIQITYDLRAPGRDYLPLYLMIESLASGGHSRPLESNWIIKTHFSVAYVEEALRTVVDRNDGLLVTELTGNMAWSNISAAAATWLSEPTPSALVLWAEQRAAAEKQREAAQALTLRQVIYGRLAG